MSEAYTSDEFWQGVRKPVESASTLPRDAYTSPGFFELEQTMVFDRGWVAVACADELSQDGSVLVRSVGSRSVLVTRNSEAEVRVFLNACRHRGTELLDADAAGLSVIRCPYHRWGYNLDGRLVATPRFTDVAVEGFDPSDYPLKSLRAEVFAGIVFACLDPTTAPIAEYYGDLGDRLAGYGLNGWKTRQTATFDIAANWKLLSENFQEYYHLTWVHPELAKVSRVKDHYRYQGPGMYCGQTTTPVSGDDRDDWLAMPAAAGLSASDAHSGRFLALFPNVMLSVLPNHAFVIQLEPLGPGRTRERCTWLLPPDSTDVTEETFAVTQDFWVDVNNEDIDICERSQRGIHNGGFTEGRYSVRFEEPLHRFANMLADQFQCRQRIPAGDQDGDASRYGDGRLPV
ncbi:MAG: aromatic ring-hydroxylating dioxygenase subunit alpha [Acidimicrobiales bacterium]|nr:aromatic ring-hydroxylating dioxygenase subunit alpha [Acidimicrobiales bacterium]